jgi:transcriptional regulator with XRE-family HTH domain
VPECWQADEVTDGSELAAFLRARRESLQPSDVGLRDGGRRRTPGLRREEVATLAGVSIDYLVRLEQGRDLHPSPAIIAALASALQLSEDERTHLFKLAVISNSTELCPDAMALVDQVAPTVRQLVERLEPSPAFVVGPLNDVLHANTAWARLVQPLGMLDGPRPNLVRYVFTHPLARTVFPDWSWAADEQVGRLRAASLRWGSDSRFTELVGELSSLKEFAARWSAHTVSEKHRGTKRVDHPHLGELRVAFEVLQLPDESEQQMIAWLAGDEVTATAFGTLADQPVPAGAPHLRVVREA